MLKPQDILVLLKLSIEPERPTYLRLAQQLHLNPPKYMLRSNVRALPTCCRDRLRRKRQSFGLLELLLHGLRYVFPPEKAL